MKGKNIIIKVIQILYILMNINNNNVLFSLKKMNKKAKYKTMLCKNFESQSGCSYNEKCQFAHGVTELKSFGSVPIFLKTDARSNDVQ